jgi:hypothetical protein
MAKSRFYIVSFSPAKRTDGGGFQVAITDMLGRERHTVAADNFAALESEVRRLARLFGQTCAPFIQLRRGERTPPGFNEFCRNLRIIDAPEAATAEA